MGSSRVVTILLVEDDEVDVKALKWAFEKLKVANPLVVARDGVEALDYLFGSGAWIGRDLTRTPPLVLLDLKLPKLDGIEVLRRIRSDARTRMIPVVILTSSDEEQDMVRGYAVGANSYVRKPIDFNEFSEAVRVMGVYWLLLNRAPGS